MDLLVTDSNEDQNEQATGDLRREDIVVHIVRVSLRRVSLEERSAHVHELIVIHNRIEMLLNASE